MRARRRTSRWRSSIKTNLMWRSARLRLKKDLHCEFEQYRGCLPALAHAAGDAVPQPRRARVGVLCHAARLYARPPERLRLRAGLAARRRSPRRPANRVRLGADREAAAGGGPAGEIIACAARPARAHAGRAGAADRGIPRGRAAARLQAFSGAADAPGALSTGRGNLSLRLGLPPHPARRLVAAAGLAGGPGVLYGVLPRSGPRPGAAQALSRVYRLA